MFLGIFPYPLRAFTLYRQSTGKLIFKDAMEFLLKVAVMTAISDALGMITLFVKQKVTYTRHLREVSVRDSLAA